MTDDASKSDSILVEWLDRSGQAEGPLSDTVGTLTGLLSSRVTELHETLESRVADIQIKLDKKLAEISDERATHTAQQNLRMDRLDQRLGSIEQTLETLHERLDEIEAGDSVKKSLERLHERLDGLKNSDPGPREGDGASNISLGDNGSRDALVLHENLTGEYVLELEIEGATCQMTLDFEDGRCRVGLHSKFSKRHSITSAFVDNQKLEFSVGFTPTHYRSKFSFSVTSGSGTVSITRKGNAPVSVSYEIIESDFS